MKNPRISVIGVGYVGLSTAVCFASEGYNVIGSDNNSEKVSKIQDGLLPFYEPKLAIKLKRALKKGDFECLHNQTERIVLDTDVTFVAVGTPSRIDDSIDLQFVQNAAHEIGRALRVKSGFHVVVIKSTVIPGTTQDVLKPILEQESQKKCGLDFGLCMNPEFLRQGSAIHDTFHPDRVVIGEYNKNSGDFLEHLYMEFYCKEIPTIIRTSLSTAELIKYASNSLLASKISFINTIANLCENIPGADVRVVAEAVGLDKRIGSLFLDAGLGYGGSCFPKDIKALIAFSKALGYRPELLCSIENVNKTQPVKAVNFCRDELNGLKDKKIAILGLSFKPKTDDMREARVIPIINQLLEEGANVKVYDPVAIPVAKEIFGNKILYASTAIDCLKNTDAAILVTEWEEFKQLTPEDFEKNMKKPILYDGRRIYNPEAYSKKLKFKAIGLG